ncbi:MAG: hypothetical protein ACLVLH_27150, partial [Eisenbergiella massiliensis]
QHYREVCKRAGVSEGAVILLNHLSYNDKGYLKDITPYSGQLQRIRLFTADGGSREVEIQAQLLKDEIPTELFYPKTNPVRLIVPGATVRGYSWMNAPRDTTGYIEYANRFGGTFSKPGECGLHGIRLQRKGVYDAGLCACDEHCHCPGN